MKTLIALLFIHWFVDFFLQNDEMACNKSTSYKWLGLHSFIYGAGFIAYGIYFAMFNTAMHFMVDGISSRLTSRLWQRGERHNFFVVIGADQFVHYAILISSAYWMGILK